MDFIKHLELKDKHSFLSASKYHWVNYDDERLLERYDKHMDAALGTRLHAWAAETIKLGILQVNSSQTLMAYVNDCIGYRMEVEQTLFYSFNAFATCDAISFGPDLDDPTQPPILRIFDLKNGETPTSEQQLEVYAAYFCLEYNVKPGKIQYDLRIYQHDQIYRFETDPEDIAFIMDRIKTFNALIEQQKEVGGGVAW